MQKSSAGALGRQQMKLAATAGGGHSADTVYGGHEKVLRQPVMGMVGGRSPCRAPNPGEATVLTCTGRSDSPPPVCRGRLRRGDLLIVPANRHSLDALEDFASS